MLLQCINVFISFFIPKGDIRYGKRKGRNKDELKRRGTKKT